MVLRRFTDFFLAWNFLQNNPIFRDNDGLSKFYYGCLDVYVVKVSPKTKCVEKDTTKNTATRVWLECGPWIKPENMDEIDKANFPQGMPTHDPNLDCGARTFEKAVIRLANLVLAHYGDGKNGQK